MALETATKNYPGVPVLMSEAYYLLLSLKTKDRCRKLDLVWRDCGIGGSKGGELIFGVGARLRCPSRYSCLIYDLYSTPCS